MGRPQLFDEPLHVLVIWRFVGWIFGSLGRKTLTGAHGRQRGVFCGADASRMARPVTPVRRYN